MQTHTVTNSRRPTNVDDRATGLAHRAPEACRLLAEAWSAMSLAGQLLAIVVAVAALATVPLADVPAAAAVTVAAAIPAVIVDLHVRRLPDLLVAAAAAAGLLTLVVSTVAGRPASIGGIVLGAVVLGGPILTLHLVSPRSMGFGDVKLGLVLGAALGAMHWQLALSGLALAAGLSAVTALARRRDTIAFGPGLLAGALLALAANPLFMPTQSEAATAPTTAIEVAVVAITTGHQR